MLGAAEGMSWGRSTTPAGVRSSPATAVRVRPRAGLPGYVAVDRANARLLPEAGYSLERVPWTSKPPDFDGCPRSSEIIAVGGRIHCAVNPADSSAAASLDVASWYGRTGSRNRSGFGCGGGGGGGEQGMMGLLAIQRGGVQRGVGETAASAHAYRQRFRQKPAPGARVSRAKCRTCSTQSTASIEKADDFMNFKIS